MATRRPRAAAVIAVMARSPAAAPDTIKTRLRTVLPDAERARLYAAFLTDTVRVVRTACAGGHASLRVFHTPEGGREGFDAVGVGPGLLRAQRGRDLGERERAVIDDCFAEGFHHALVIGSDLPTLPAAILTHGLHLLRTHPTDMVLGPAEDGGYYAIGLSSPSLARRDDVPDVFTGVRWSTEHALADTTQCARRLALAVHLLDSWFDVDDGASLARLVESLHDDDVKRRAPATARWNEERRTLSAEATPRADPPSTSTS